MKTKLLFTKKQSNGLFALFVFCLCFNYGWSQNLTLDSTMDDHGTTGSGSTTDNADAWDMTPNSTILDESGATIDSPYRYDDPDNLSGWYNSDLDSWLGTNTGDTNDQPGSSSDGNWDYSAGPTMGVKTRGVKLYSVGRRLYQKVAVTAGISHTLLLESRSEAAGVPSEVYILNTEIADETGINANGYADTAVDAGMDITNDFNSSKSNATTDNFTKTTLEFTPSGSFVVIYVRAPLAVSDVTEVFYDNIELYVTSTLSAKDVLASKLNIYPNPAQDYIQIDSKDVQISSVQMYSLIGQEVISGRSLVNNRIDISSLSRGVYLLKVNSESGSLTKKIIVE